MPILSFTTISRLLGFAAFVAALAYPVQFAGKWLVGLYSSQLGHMAQVHLAVENMQGRKILLVGDSTIRLLHQTENDIITDQRETNVSAGGSIVPEWYYLVKLALDRPNQLDIVVAGFVNPCSRLESNMSSNTFLPFLMSWGDVYRDWRGGYLTRYAAGRLLFLSAVPLLHSKDEVLLRVVSELAPSLQPLMQDVFRTEGVKASSRIPFENATLDKQKDLRRFIALVREKGKKLLFVHVPVASVTRTAELKSCISRYQSQCAAEGWNCRDLSASLGDDSFEPDNVHVKLAALPKYRALLDSTIEAARSSP